MSRPHQTGLIVLAWLLLSLSPAWAESLETPPDSDTETAAGPEDAPDEEPPDLVPDTRGSNPAPGLDRHTPQGFEVPWLSFSPRVGYAYIMAANITSAYTISDRHALMATLGFDMGGEGMVMTLAPTYLFEAGAGELADFHSIGLYLGMDFRWRWWNLVPSAGLGFRGSYLTGESIDQGLELVGRFPFALTWYPTYTYSLIFEVGLGYGATGVVAPKAGVPDLQLGHSFIFDLSIGSRFP
jgi:hypothetical protein